jgi:hypothetical protein
MQVEAEMAGGTTRPLFRGPRDRRWWHVEHGGPESKWVLDVLLDQIERVRFVRETNPWASFPGEELLAVRFEADWHQTALHCYPTGQLGERGGVVLAAADPDGRVDADEGVHVGAQTQRISLRG